jgi:hypothetical protein
MGVDPDWWTLQFGRTVEDVVAAAIRESRRLKRPVLVRDDPITSADVLRSLFDFVSQSGARFRGTDWTVDVSEL